MDVLVRLDSIDAPGLVLMGGTEARKRWARRMMAQVEGPTPPYGSAEWLSLAEGDPRKVAAVVRAAECWATEGDDLEGRLRAEVEAERAAFKAAEDAEYVVRRDAHRAAWNASAGGFRPDPALAVEVEQEWKTWAGEAS